MRERGRAKDEGNGFVSLYCSWNVLGEMLWYLYWEGKGGETGWVGVACLAILLGSFEDINLN